LRGRIEIHHAVLDDYFARRKDACRTIFEPDQNTALIAQLNRSNIEQIGERNESRKVGNRTKQPRAIAALFGG
jgi:hypothetical protein